MSTDTRATASQDHRTARTKEPTSTRRGRLGRVTLGTFLGGTAGAVGLTLGVVAGATESIITGSVLVSSGLGWGALALLSTRTSQPQRWASVPAVAMTAVGLGLLVLQPGNSALSAMTWIWPMLMLVLVAWMSVRIRREMSGYGRWLLTAVSVVLALASVGATYESIAAAHDSHSYPAPGQMFEVNGHRLHLDCHGEGGPTVVLFNGLGEVSASWARITSAVGQTTRVCAYDRAGQGWSEPAQHPQDGVTAAEDLHSLLAAAGEQGPYVLAGHSIGGPLAMTYAARHPSQVAGMVLLDSSSPYQFTRLPDYPGVYAMLRRYYALTPTLYRLGVGRLLDAVAPSGLPGDAADQVRAVTSSARAARSMRDEASMLHEVFAQAQALTTLESQPLAVLTASASLADTKGWAAAQDALAALSVHRVHRVVDSSHAGLLLDAGPAAESVRAISGVVDAVRSD